MTLNARHLGIEELEARFRGATTVIERSHCQAIWLLAKGHTTAEVADVTALTPRWVNKLARRYERDGADALGDRRRRNAGGKPLLSARDLEVLRERLRTPPDDGGLWTGPKVARWIAARLGLAHVHAPRGWETLKKLNWSIQSPRPRNPKAATPEQQMAFKKTSPMSSPSKPRDIPTCRSRSGPPTSIGSV
jgi:transposase